LTDAEKVRVEQKTSSPVSMPAVEGGGAGADGGGVGATDGLAKFLLEGFDVGADGGYPVGGKGFFDEG
jgi:hypothetical protein